MSLAANHQATRQGVPACPKVAKAAGKVWLAKTRGGLLAKKTKKTSCPLTACDKIFSGETGSNRYNSTDMIQPIQLFIYGCNNLFILIIAAFRANPVRHFGFMALRA